MRTIAQPTVSVNSASSALLAANARLQRLREQAVTRAANPHGGNWARLQREGGVANAEGAGRGSFLVIPTVAEKQPSSTGDNAFLRMYPDLLLGMLRQERVAIGRIWLLCRHLDKGGRGWLDVTFVREQLTRKTSPLRIIGQRRLRQILKDGAGIFWERDQLGRLWLYGTARVAAALGVERLTGRPIALPIADLITSLANTRAHCYAAFHSGRSIDGMNKLASPISRATLAELAGITGRTQRRYDEIAGIESRTCIAIGAPFDTTQHAETTWQRGNATFQLTDHCGKLGVVGKIYSAWQLPNQYRGCHAQLPKGRQRKLNRQLRSLATSNDDLVNLRARGNGLVTQPNETMRDKFAQIFFHNGRQAARSSSGYLLDRAVKDGGVWLAIV